MPKIRWQQQVKNYTLWGIAESHPRPDYSSFIHENVFGMPLYVICHLGRQRDSSEARARLRTSIQNAWMMSELEVNGPWLVKADSTSDEIRDRLIDLVAEGDGLLVVRAGRDAAWAGFDPSSSEWFLNAF